MVFNFGAGPGKLPEMVLLKAQEEMMDYQGTGMSVMELSHRSSHFESILNGACDRLRQIMSIPSSHQILFLPGGGSTQFSAVPLNLLSETTGRVDYILTGTWSRKAHQEAKKLAPTSVVVNAIDQVADVSVGGGAAKYSWEEEAPLYLYYCDNETVEGVEFASLDALLAECPYASNSLNIVCDMSSNFMSRPVDFSRYAVIFAGAQKNIGPAGVTLVIVRQDILRSTALLRTPSMLNYQLMAKHNSLYNTPPCYPIYICGLVFEWCLKGGSLDQMHKNRIARSRLLYDCIGNSNGFYRCTAREKFRSEMNVTFRICTLASVGDNLRSPDESVERQFLLESAALGFVQLAGHRSVGGIRASLYNAMPCEAVIALVNFMSEFSAKRSS